MYSMIIPLAWQFHDLFCAIITYNSFELITKNFKKTPLKLTDCSEINNVILDIEVYNLENRIVLLDGKRAKNTKIKYY